jgi:UDP-N-acetyl-2-amino-2-deoxyglucuronate dehydrogenase
VGARRNFAILGVAGYIAPRHLDAIAAAGHRLVAAADPCDSVGLLDRYSPDVEFFRQSEELESFLHQRRRGSAAGRVDYVSICSPTDLHEAHLRLALGAGADALCEKPLVVDARSLDSLEELERVTGRRIFTVLQLRLHPTLLALRQRIADGAAAATAEVELTYVTPRGRWYEVSWKGSEERSGGIVLNIGIHCLDLLIWLFGAVRRSEVHLREERRAAGFLELERATVRWFLSIAREDLPATAGLAGMTAHRTMAVDGSEIDFSAGFGDLHRKVYEATLAGAGAGIADARPALELAHAIRSAPLTSAATAEHPLIRRREVAR